MIGEGDEPGPARTLIPPRPNLGPEPWDAEGGPWSGTAIGIGSGLVLVALLLAWKRDRARRRHRALDRDNPSSAPPAPTDPWIAASEAARAALVRAFGPSWRSKTTEEIAADSGLRDRLGPDRADDLIALFLRADRAKFAADVAPGADGEETASADRGLSALEALAAGSARTGPRSGPTRTREESGP